ncbi:DNA polymerase III subunit delta' [Neoroseomonas oryzicola]|uniref:DNA polymerase III subunit delta n=1 Tax=Neoroseomonas oryzicola TaxID=535904 RepID=A0A9X9WHN7_9PROT|nr:DNA polymerase III subunit delta' [Neoroseomonas oryzicola]MBR0659847.1 DNA polymerase III subunit delta' [Neoroseomonas oryzicola]NKE15713.1 DNA polymerase III subunit delta' [Neoroseomonas oryzicola]
MTDPRANPDLVGHDEAARSLEAAARSGRLHHAWLLCGPPGIGKATLAWRFARWLLAGMPDGPLPLFVDPASSVFRRVAADTHADCFTLEPNTGDRGTKRVLRVEDAREAVRFLTQTAAEGGWRVVVMDEAERVDQAAVQNTLLKTLEEPPPRTVLLLVCSAPQRLLPTIRSRCRRLDLNPLAPGEMEALLARLLPETGKAERARLALLAQGSPGRALALAEAGGLELQAMVDKTLGALAKGDPPRDHGLADRLAMDRTGGAFGIFMGLLRGAIAGALREAARGQVAPAWLARHPLAVWASLWDRLGTLADDTERLNLDRKQAVLTGLSWLARP